MQQRRRDLPIAHDARDVLRREVRVIRHERHVEILRQETTVVLEAVAVRAQCAYLGVDNEIRDAGVGGTETRSQPSGLRLQRGRTGCPD